MSDAQHHDHADAPHEGPIKTPKQVIAAVVAGFLIPITIIVLAGVAAPAGTREVVPVVASRDLHTYRNRWLEQMGIST